MFGGAQGSVTAVLDDATISLLEQSSRTSYASEGMLVFGGAQGSALLCQLLLNSDATISPLEQSSRTCIQAKAMHVFGEAQRVQHCCVSYCCTP